MQLEQKHCLYTVSVTHTNNYQPQTVPLNILKVCPQKSNEFLFKDSNLLWLPAQMPKTQSSDLFDTWDLAQAYKFTCLNLSSYT